MNEQTGLSYQDLEKKLVHTEQGLATAENNWMIAAAHLDNLKRKSTKTEQSLDEYQDKYIRTAAKLENLQRKYERDTKKESDVFKFDKPRFRTKKETDKYVKCQNVVNSPSPAPNERMKALRYMIAADNGEIDGIKQLPAPN